MATAGTTSADWGFDPRNDERIKNVALMKRYAAEQLRDPGRDIHIALGLIPDAPIAAAAVNVWNNDPIVIQERLRLQEEHGQRAELPTKETIALEILALARAEKHSVPDRLKAYDQYNQMMQYIGRNANQPGSVNIFSNKVMLLKDHGSNDDWEARAVAQQSGLVKQAQDDARRTETAH